MRIRLWWTAFDILRFFSDMTKPAKLGTFTAAATQERLPHSVQIAWQIHESPIEQHLSGEHSRYSPLKREPMPLIRPKRLDKCAKAIQIARHETGCFRGSCGLEGIASAEASLAAGRKADG